MKEAIEHYEAALKEAFPRGASGDVFHHWNEARKALEKPAQDEPVAIHEGHELYWIAGRAPANPDVDGFLYTRPQARERVLFPTMLRKMWSGSEVQAWLDENVNKEKNHG